MYFQFTCSECGKNLKVREENVGRKVRCPYCHHAMTVKAPEKEEVPEDPWDLDLSESTKSATQTEEKPPPDKQPSAKAGWIDGTEVHTVRSALIGIALSVAFYGMVYGVGKAAFAGVVHGVGKAEFAEGYYFGELFLDRGWVPFALVFLMSWSAAILFLKSRKLSRQKDSMLFDLLPNELADDITVTTLSRFTQHVRSLPANPSESFLINRVLRGLEHFRVLKSNPEVAGRLASQSEIDATAVESSYTMLKVFIWAIPILGFIGTVIGISAAVSGFSGSLDNAQDIDALRSSLDSVTSGLATAFDTTLVALVMSLLVMFPTSSMQKAEEDLLNWVDEYCNENLLKRLKDSDRISGVPTGDRKAMHKAIDAAMANHHAEFRTWFKKLETIGATLTQQVVKGWTDFDGQQQAKHTENLEQLSKAVESMTAQQAAMQDWSKYLDTIGARVTEHVVRGWEKVDKQLRTQYEQQFSAIAESQERIQQDLSRMIEHLAQSMTEIGAKLNQAAETQTRAIQERTEEQQGRVAEELTRAVDRFGETMTDLAKQGETVQNQVSDSMTRASESLGVYFRGLEQGLTVLNGVLERLGEQQVVIESHIEPRRRWGFFRRGNGVE